MVDLVAQTESQFARGTTGMVQREYEDAEYVEGVVSGFPLYNVLC